MNVVFDLSSQALWHGSKSGMRGIYRVVDSLLPELSKQVNNFICSSTENSALAGDYLNHKGFEIPFRKTLLHQTISRSAGVANGIHEANMADYPMNKRLTRKISRKATSETTKLLTHMASASSRFPLDGINIFHQPAPFQIPEFIRAHSRSNFARFMTIYDFIPFSDGHPHPREALYLQSVFDTLGADDFVICISEYVKNETCERLKLKPENIFVAPLAASPSLFYPNDSKAIIENIREQFHLGDKPYFLSLCALDPRKNMKLLLEAFGELCAQRTDMEVNLVLAGNAPKEEIANLKAYAKQSGIANRLLLPGFIPDQDLAALYSGALAFVFPSLAEGFGLPPLEAMQCGTPVICSNMTSLPEVVGHAGILFDPADIDSLCSAMEKLHDEPSTAERYSKTGIARAAEYSWERCAQAHLYAYSQALGR